MAVKNKKQAIEKSVSVEEESTAMPIEEVYKHADKMSKKQQILTHLEVVQNVLEYAILSEKDGVHSLVSSLPQEINDLMALWQTGAVSKYQKGIIAMIILESKDRLVAYQKMLDEQSKPKLIT